MKEKRRRLEEGRARQGIISRGSGRGTHTGMAELVDFVERENAFLR